MESIYGNESNLHPLPPTHKCRYEWFHTLASTWMAITWPSSQLGARIRPARGHFFVAVRWCGSCWTHRTCEICRDDQLWWWSSYRNCQCDRSTRGPFCGSICPGALHFPKGTSAEEICLRAAHRPFQLHGPVLWSRAMVESLQSVVRRFDPGQLHHRGQPAVRE